MDKEMRNVISKIDTITNNQMKILKLQTSIGILKVTR